MATASDISFGDGSATGDLQGGAACSFVNIEDVRCKASSGDDVLTVGFGGSLQGNIVADGGGGANRLNVIEGNVSEALHFSVDANGAITTNVGQYTNFQSFGLALSSGDDVVQCGAGDDYIKCGVGADTMSGGAGADTFGFWNKDDFTEKGGGGMDHITDFSHDEGDRIDLSLIDAVKNVKGDLATKGNQAFGFIGEAAFDGHSGELRFTDNGDGTLTVQGDLDGDKTADFSLLVTTAHPLVAGDFVL